MSRRRVPLHVFPLSHLDRSSYYERVVASIGSSPFPAQYAELVAVSSGGVVTVLAPPVGAGTEQTTKDGFHFGVVSTDGTGPTTIQGNGKNINGAASIVLPAFAGASAHLYYSNVLGEWVAFLGAGVGAFSPPPTYTAKGPAAPQTFTNAGLVAVNGASITTAPFSASQKAIITYSAVLHNSGAGAPAQTLCAIFDGTAAVTIDVFEQDLDTGDTTENIDHEVVSWTVEVVGNGLARTFGMSVETLTANNATIEINRCRGVVQIVDG
jgi:hypothetical protein